MNETVTKYAQNDTVIVDNRKNCKEKYYKELPDTLKGVVFDRPYDGATKLKVVVEGYTNSRSKYGVYYFPLKKIQKASQTTTESTVEDKSTVPPVADHYIEWEEVKNFLYNYYRQKNSLYNTVDTYEAIKALNKDYFTRKFNALMTKEK